MLEDKNTHRTHLSELGEFGLIDLLTKDFPIVNPSTLKGVGDDGAVIDFGNQKAVISSAILRKIVELENQGAELFFGERSFETEDLLRTDEKGRGVVNIYPTY